MGWGQAGLGRAAPRVSLLGRGEDVEKAALPVVQAKLKFQVRLTQLHPSGLTARVMVPVAAFHLPALLGSQGGSLNTRIDTRGQVLAEKPQGQTGRTSLGGALPS